MQFSRRQFIEAGAATGALAALSSPILAAVSDPEIRRPAPISAAPPRPRLTADPAIGAALIARARASFDRHRSSLRQIDTVAIVDFSKASSEARFFLLDTNSGRVSRHFVSHGRGSDPGHTGFLQRFSNQFGSEASSNGAYVTGDYYPGKYGRSMRVRGLDPSNSNAEDRAIVVHSAWYAEPDVLAQTGRLGRSEGCFALSHTSLREVLSRLGPGHFLYADRLA
jgi:hypothetical protein